MENPCVVVGWFPCRRSLPVGRKRKAHANSFPLLANISNALFFWFLGCGDDGWRRFRFSLLNRFSIDGGYSDAPCTHITFHWKGLRLPRRDPHRTDMRHKHDIGSIHPQTHTNNLPGNFQFEVVCVCTNTLL